jgi:RNA polymerase sigma-70 factor (ECF subfamily)
MLSAWQHRAALRDPTRFAAWVAQIVRYEAIRHASRRRRATAPLETEPGHDDEEIARAEKRVDLSRALAELEPRERRLLRLRYEEDLTQRAIAERLGLPEGTVKVQLHRARAKLHRALSQR